MARNGDKNTTQLSSTVSLCINDEAISEIARAVLKEVCEDLDWPNGRIALTEPEAAAALGVPRHVLRDFRLSGRVKFTRIGRKILYTRSQLLCALQAESS